MKMLHVTIHTASFEEELKFYQEIVGLTIVNDMRKVGRDLVFLANAEGETCIEIIRDPAVSDAGNQALSIGFHTDDVAQKKAELEALGLETTQIISPAPGVQFFYVKDPAGVRIQFI